MKKADANRLKLAEIRRLGLHIHRGEKNPRWNGGSKTKSNHPCHKCGRDRECEGRNASRPCRKCYYAEYSKTKPDTIARARKRYNERAEENKAKAFTMRGGKCVRCGVSDLPLCCFHFHHREPEHKKFTVGTALHQKWSQRIEDEVIKCDVLCANCHAIVTVVDKHPSRKSIRGVA